MSGYVAGLGQEIASAESLAIRIGAEFDRRADSIYLGGGTPTTLEADQLSEVFRIVHGELDVDKQAEVTVECAPGTLRPEILETMLDAGVNRVSLGAQSFVDQEIRSVGRLHTTEQARVDVASLRKNGISNINVDLIAGLPHQTSQSWQTSLEQLAELNVPHASVYILEVDDESRLGRELIAGGERYHAHHVPDSDLSAEMYLQALDFLAKAGLAQYEISNLCRPGRESRHNIKYWTRQPYLGFGLDAHSMLPARDQDQYESIRFSNTENLETYITNPTPSSFERIDRHRAVEESMFLPLRLNRGVDLNHVGFAARKMFESEICELIELGLLQQHENWLSLTPRGRLLSNEVFERFISDKQIA